MLFNINSRSAARCRELPSPSTPDVSCATPYLQPPSLLPLMYQVTMDESSRKSGITKKGCLGTYPCRSEVICRAALLRTERAFSLYLADQVGTFGDIGRSVILSHLKYRRGVTQLHHFAFFKLSCCSRATQLLSRCRQRTIDKQ